MPLWENFISSLTKMTPVNIINGFRTKGLKTHNPSVIPDSAFVPSLTTERRFPTKTDQENANVIDTMEANEINNNLS